MVVVSDLRTLVGLKFARTAHRTSLGALDGFKLYSTSTTSASFEAADNAICVAARKIVCTPVGLIIASRAKGIPRWQIHHRHHDRHLGRYG